MRSRRSPRRGYALMQVVVFVVLFLVILGVASRQLASVLRVETVRVQQARRDQGSVVAVALGLTLLETGLPPSDPYSCAAPVTTANGTASYTVTFASDGSGGWNVSAAPSTGPGDQFPAMPSTFVPASVP